MTLNLHFSIYSILVLLEVFFLSFATLIQLQYTIYYTARKKR